VVVVAVVLFDAGVAGVVCAEALWATTAHNRPAAKFTFSAAANLIGVVFFIIFVSSSLNGLRQVDQMPIAT
jgi:hypothetical protein